MGCGGRRVGHQTIPDASQPQKKSWLARLRRMQESIRMEERGGGVSSRSGVLGSVTRVHGRNKKIIDRYIERRGRRALRKLEWAR